MGDQKDYRQETGGNQVLHQDFHQRHISLLNDYSSSMNDEKIAIYICISVRVVVYQE